MTRCEFHTEGERITGFSVSGHSDYDEPGKDIVCAAVSAVLNALGASAEVQPDGLIIHGVSALHGGDVSACGDHRIALLAGCAAMVADGPVTLSGAETVAKSYPAFWRELAALGGNWEVLES